VIFVVRQLSMSYVLYALAWAMMFASGTSCMMLYKGKLEPDQLPSWLRGDFGRKYAYPLLLVVWFSAIALLVFGFSRLRWYWVPGGIVAGLITSAVIQGWLRKSALVVAGPPFLIALQAGLWLSSGTAALEAGVRGTCGACGAAHWSRVSSPGGGFFVMMPSPVEESSATNETKVGSVARSYFTARPSPKVSFELCHSRFPTNVDMKDKAKALDAAVKGGIGKNGRLVSSSAITLRGYPGRHGTEEHGGGVVVTFRLYLVGHDLFQLACEMPKTRMCSKHLSQFLESFDLETAAEAGVRAEPGAAPNGGPTTPIANSGVTEGHHR
jgi:hypothetical protein